MRKEVRCFCIIGNNNTGKSVVASAIIDSWQAKNPNGFVAAFDPQKRFKKDIDIKSEEDLNDLSSMKNSLIAFDDFRKIHPNERATKWLSDLMDNRYEHGLDLIFIFHSPKRVIEFITYYADVFVVFFTNYKKEDVTKKIPDSDMLLEALSLVKEEYRINGGGYYPIFPHVMAIPNENLIVKINFKTSVDYGKSVTII